MNESSNIPPLINPTIAGMDRRLHQPDPPLGELEGDRQPIASLHRHQVISTRAVSESPGKAGALPLDPDGVPPLSSALRGGSHLYHSCRAVNLICCRAADADLGTDESGSGAYGPVVRSTPAA